MSKQALIQEALNTGEGVVRLAPCWVPRSFLMPGGRLKLDSRDLYALGAHRGGIDERWFSSTTNAANGPGTPADEGLSYLAFDGQKILFKEAIELLGDKFLGAAVMTREGGWNLLCKFFDNLGPIPHHMHQRDEHARLVGQRGKPEAYYFPPQYNFKLNNFPYTFMGLEPGTKRDDIVGCLKRWNKGDNGILDFSKAYKLQPGTGWQVNAGILHAPGSLVTYEPQVNSDVFAMFQSMVEGRYVPWDLLVKDVPAEKAHDLDYLINMLDWEANVDPEFASHNLTKPSPVRDGREMEDAGYRELWVTYGTRHYSAKELTVFPGRSVTVKDAAAYGLILTQGFGRLGVHRVETPSLIRFGELTNDELFVSADSAANGVKITNESDKEPLVMLKHFGPVNPDAGSLIARDAS
ncbi:MAG: hypothetical protein JO210_14155 [Acidobacteriaceae bacterium]|nr:hypothetical protein [Acidobacteriaceae bacterium]